MDFDDHTGTPRQRHSLVMDQTLTAPLNNTIDFMGLGHDLGQTTVGYEQMLDEGSRELLKHGFKKIAKKNEYIRIDDVGLAFRQSGQNPTEDIIKDMIDKARQLKQAQLRETDEDEDEQPDDRLSFPDFLALVHEYWVPLDDEKQQLQDAFDILDPQNKSKLMVDEFVHLLKNCDWPDEEIDLLLSQVSCADGYFLHDDLQKLLLTPVDVGKKKGGKSKSSGKKKSK